MKRSAGTIRLPRMTLPLLGLFLIPPGLARAQTSYKIQPILKLGDLAGDVRTKANSYLEIGTLNDRGQLIFDTQNADGNELLLQYGDGKFTSIVVGGGGAPGGKWPRRDLVLSPVRMNQAGNAVFLAPVTAAGKTAAGIFLWDYEAQQVTPVVMKEMPAANDLTFREITGFRPTINDGNEIAFAAQTRKASGNLVDMGVFFRGPGGQVLPVALPGQALPNGLKVGFAIFGAIDNRGRVAFLAVPQGRSWPRTHAYLWSGPREAGDGEFTLLAASGTGAPGGGTFAHVDGVWLNNANRSVLIQGILNSVPAGSRALYRFADGKLAPVAVPGQEMPGGGQFKTHTWIGVSYANEQGQHAFLAEIVEEGHSRTAAYLLDADGKLSLILKSDITTELGKITRIGEPGTSSNNPSYLVGVGLNSQGQVALPVRIDNGPPMIVLLTPTAP